MVKCHWQIKLSGKRLSANLAKCSLIIKNFLELHESMNNSEYRYLTQELCILNSQQESNKFELMLPSDMRLLVIRLTTAECSPLTSF